MIGNDACTTLSPSAVVAGLCRGLLRAAPLGGGPPWPALRRGGNRREPLGAPPAVLRYRGRDVRLSARPGDLVRRRRLSSGRWRRRRDRRPGKPGHRSSPNPAALFPCNAPVMTRAIVPKKVV